MASLAANAQEEVDAVNPTSTRPPGSYPPRRVEPAGAPESSPNRILFQRREVHGRVIEPVQGS